MATPSAAAPQRTIDFGRAFSFVGEDPDWVRKILIGGAFTLACAVLVGIPFVLGYSSRTLRNVASGARLPLPEWDDLGGIFEDGLRLAVVYLAHTLGIVIVIGLCAAVLLTPIFMASSRHGERSDALGFAGALGILLLYAIVVVVSLAVALYLPAALARSALSGRIGTAFEWRANLCFIRDNLGNYALALVSYLVASFLSQFGFLLCCIGVFPAAFWSHLVLAVALGETVRVSPHSY